MTDYTHGDAMRSLDRLSRGTAPHRTVEDTNTVAAELPDPTPESDEWWSGRRAILLIQAWLHGSAPASSKLTTVQDAIQTVLVEYDHRMTAALEAPESDEVEAYSIGYDEYNGDEVCFTLFHDGRQQVLAYGKTARLLADTFHVAECAKRSTQIADSERESESLRSALTEARERAEAAERMVGHYQTIVDTDTKFRATVRETYPDPDAMAVVEGGNMNTLDDIYDEYLGDTAPDGIDLAAEHEEPRWYPTDEASFEWALRHRNKAASEADRVRRLRDYELQLLASKFDRRIWAAETEAAFFADMVTRGIEARDPSERKVATVLGTVSTRTTQHFEWPDDDALVAWARAVLPDAVRVKVSADKVAIKTYIAATGDAPDGLTVEPRTTVVLPKVEEQP